MAIKRAAKKAKRTKYMEDRFIFKRRDGSIIEDEEPNGDINPLPYLADGALPKVPVPTYDMDTQLEERIPAPADNRVTTNLDNGLDTVEIRAGGDAPAPIITNRYHQSIVMIIISSSSSLCHHKSINASPCPGRTIMISSSSNEVFS